MPGSFAILSFLKVAADEVAYIEYAVGSLYLEKPEEVRIYGLMHDRLRASALDRGTRPH